jgi:hypothetical protein
MLKVEFKENYLNQKQKIMLQMHCVFLSVIKNSPKKIYNDFIHLKDLNKLK